MASDSIAVDDMETMAHRFDQFFVHKYRDKTRIKEAMATQDRIRAKTSGKWNGAKEIRDWRDRRYS